MTSLVLVLSALSVNADPAPVPVPADPPHVRQAVERSLGFLDKNKFGFGCISCHDGPLMIWSAHEAEKRGFSVNRKSVDLLHGRAVKSYAGHAGLKPTGMDQGHDLSVNTMYLTVAFMVGPVRRCGNHGTPGPDGSLSGAGAEGRRPLAGDE